VEKVVTLIVGILLIPILLLNIFGGLVTGIILAIGGDWAPLLLGLLFMFVGVFIISILMLPSLIVMGLAIFFANRKSRLGVGFCVLASQALIYAIMFGVSYVVFGTILESSSEANEIVLLIWSFVVATTPWNYMASKEQDNEGTQLTLFASQIGLFAVLVLTGFFNYGLDESFGLVAAFTAIPIILTTLYAIHKIHNSGESLLIDGSQPKNSQFSQQELIAFFVCLLHIAKSDGSLHIEEIKQVRRSFQEVTGERIGKGFVERIYFALDTGAIKVESIIDEAQGSISDDMKHNIIMGAYRIAQADNEVKKEEIVAIKEVGKELGLAGKEIAGILKA
jgi:uncharacterized tellurite resistance protein B-like protein